MLLMMSMLCGSINNGLSRCRFHLYVKPREAALCRSDTLSRWNLCHLSPVRHPLHKVTAWVCAEKVRAGKRRRYSERRQQMTDTRPLKTGQGRRVCAMKARPELKKKKIFKQETWKTKKHSNRWACEGKQDSADDGSKKTSGLDLTFNAQRTEWHNRSNLFCFYQVVVSFSVSVSQRCQQSDAVGSRRGSADRGTAQWHVRIVILIFYL